MDAAVPEGIWTAALGERSARAVLARRIEGALRFAGSVAVAADSEAASAVERLLSLPDVAANGPPLAVVVDVPVPLRIAAFAPRQELYDRVVRPAVTAFGCACAGGGLDAPQDRRPGALEMRLRQTLAAHPDALVIWDDGTPPVQRWWSALDAHLEAGSGGRRVVVLTPRGARAATLLAPRASLRRLVWDPGGSAGSMRLWTALADLWREQHGAAWQSGAIAPRLRVETLIWAVRLFAAQITSPAVVLDLGLDAVAAYVADRDDVSIHRRRFSGREPGTFAARARELLPGADADLVAALVERRLRGVPPADAKTLDAELVLAAAPRGLLAAGLADARLVATGALLEHVADPARVGLWLLEAARPLGRGVLHWDDADALSALAALAPVCPEIATTILNDGCLPLGTYLTDGDNGRRTRYTVRRFDGATVDWSAQPGGLSRFPLPPGEDATVQTGAAAESAPQPPRAGAAPRTRGAGGGPLGLVVDRRPRQRDTTLASFAADLAALRGPDAGDGQR